ncbi:EpsG family protein [Riemerella anatipestifer]|uniref:EpsG family protein n=1 Tax=Riemerella anatipestifer TaxID=34085 RepID=UPI002A8FE7C0|nr:EpsG family protein [Riemerella anatipestifer]
MFFLPLVYAIGIGLYTPPPTYDLNHYYRYYRYFSEYHYTSPKIYDLAISFPDYISQLFIFILAKSSLPLGIFLFTVTYLTIFNFLYVFRYFYKVYRQEKIKEYVYLIVFASISLPAVLSGIRNIHALSFVALALMFFHKRKNNMVFLCLLYAGLFHFSTYIYLLIFLVIRLFEHFNFRKEIVLKVFLSCAVLLSVIIFFIKLVPSVYLEALMPYSLYLKTEFYLKKTDILVNQFYLMNWKSLIKALLYTYSLLIVFVLSFYKELRNQLKSNVYIVFLLLPCVITFFYPNTFSRYMMLVNVAITFYVLIIRVSFWKRKIIVMNVLFIFALQLVLFLKYIMKF